MLQQHVNEFAKMFFAVNSPPTAWMYFSFFSILFGLIILVLKIPLPYHQWQLITWFALYRRNVFVLLYSFETLITKQWLLLYLYTCWNISWLSHNQSITLSEITRLQNECDSVILWWLSMIIYGLAISIFKNAVTALINESAKMLFIFVLQMVFILHTK